MIQIYPYSLVITCIGQSVVDKVVHYLIYLCNIRIYKYIRLSVQHHVIVLDFIQQREAWYYFTKMLRKVHLLIFKLRNAALQL